MKSTIICHLAAFLSVTTYSEQMTNNYEYHILLLTLIYKYEFVIVCINIMAESKLVQLNLHRTQ